MQWQPWIAAVLAVLIGSSLVRQLESHHDRVFDFLPPQLHALHLSYVVLERRHLEPIETFFNQGFNFTSVYKNNQSLYLAVTPRLPYHQIEIHQGPSNRFLGFGVVVPSMDFFAAARWCETTPHCINLDRTFHSQDYGNFTQSVLRFLSPFQFYIDILWESAVTRPPVGLPKLGHIVFEAHDIDPLLLWFVYTLGFQISDLQVIQNSTTIATAFLRCTGNTDHHSLALVRGFSERATIHHIAFEVKSPTQIQWQLQALGQPYAEHVWGIGFHTIGQQLFDYWRDPGGGEIFEAYQTELKVDPRAETNISSFSKHALNEWQEGPLPGEFGGITLGNIIRALALILRHPSELPRLLAQAW